MTAPLDLKLELAGELQRRGTRFGASVLAAGSSRWTGRGRKPMPDVLGKPTIRRTAAELLRGRGARPA